MAFLDLTGLTRYTTKIKAWVSSLIKNNSTTTDSGYVLDASQAPLLKVLKKSYGSISALGTINDSDVTADMVVVASQLGTPSAQKSDWTVTANAGSFTLAGTIDGTTTLTIYWARSRGTGNTTSVIPYGDNAYSAQNTDINDKKVLLVDVPSFTVLPQTVTNSKITSDMVVVWSMVSKRYAQASDWTVKTYDGYLTIEGTLALGASTSMRLVLAKYRA